MRTYIEYRPCSQRVLIWTESEIYGRFVGSGLTRPAERCQPLGPSSSEIRRRHSYRTVIWRRVKAGRSRFRKTGVSTRSAELSAPPRAPVEGLKWQRASYANV